MAPECPPPLRSPPSLWTLKNHLLPSEVIATFSIAQMNLCLVTGERAIDPLNERERHQLKSDALMGDSPVLIHRIHTAHWSWVLRSGVWNMMPFMSQQARLIKFVRKGNIRKWQLVVDPTGWYLNWFEKSTLFMYFIYIYFNGTVKIASKRSHIMPQNSRNKQTWPSILMH